MFCNSLTVRLLSCFSKITLQIVTLENMLLVFAEAIIGMADFTINKENLYTERYVDNVSTLNIYC